MQDLLNQRLIFVSGKGGVGKSTVACKLALLQSQLKKNTLLIELNSQNTAAQWFGIAAQPHTLQSLSKSLQVINLQPQSCFKEYVLRQIKFEFLYKTFFENNLVKHFVQAVPGLNELLMLGKIIDLLPSYDSIVVDAQASGHGLSSMQVPYVVMQTVKFGPLHRQAKKIVQTLEDAKQTSITLVTLPEEMPVNEAIETFGHLQKTSLRFGGLFINQELPNVIQIAKPVEDLPNHLKPYWQIYEFAKSRFEEQQEHLSSLQKHFAKEKTYHIFNAPNGIHNKNDLNNLEIL